MSNWSMFQGVQRDATRTGRSFEDPELRTVGVPRVPVGSTDDASLHRMVLITEAIWELVADKLGLTDEELEAKIAEIDARSGTIDGRRAAPERRICPSCQAAVGGTATRCQFCGADTPDRDPFAV